MERLPAADRPTWYGDVEPVLRQYANLYPIMRDFLNLGDYESVCARASLLAFAFELRYRPELDARQP